MHDSSLSQSNYYQMSAQQALWQPRYSSGGSVEGPSSVGSVDYPGYQGGPSLWQPSGSYGSSNSHQYIQSSGDYSTFTASPASVPSDISGYSLGSPAVPYHYSSPGSIGSPHTLALSMSPQQSTLSVIHTPPSQSAPIPTRSPSVSLIPFFDRSDFAKQIIRPLRPSCRGQRSIPTVRNMSSS